MPAAAVPASADAGAPGSDRPSSLSSRSGPPPGGAPGDGPRRILVVDDNRDSADSLALLLQLDGHDTHTAYDGEEAVAAAERLQPDVVLLDLGLPRIDGCEACRRIRAQPWAQRALLVAVTGWGQAADRRRSQEAGFDGHLVKPVDPAALVQLIAECGQRPRAG